MSKAIFEKELKYIKQWTIPHNTGYVTKVYGFFVEITGLIAALGDFCFIFCNQKKIIAEVIKIDKETLTLSCFEKPMGISYGASVYLHKALFLKKPSAYLGKIINACGEALNKEPICGKSFSSYENSHNSEKQKICHLFHTGVKAIDGLCSVGKGQKIGIFSSAGEGKTSLLTMITKNSSADINIIALIGERGREIQTYIHLIKKFSILDKTIIIVSPAEEIFSLKILAAHLSIKLAEFFKNEGKSVLFIMDSLSRFAQALQEQQDILSHNKSSFNHLSSQLAAFIEKSGNFLCGSITSFYSILIPKEMHSDPLENIFCSLLDGHIYLNKDYDKSYYPSINIAASLSRTMKDLVSSSDLKNAQLLKSWVLEYLEYKDLINVGAYIPNSNPNLDKAIHKKQNIINFMKQTINENYSFQETMLLLQQVVS